ncbi:DUF983 domain-containing protein [Sphingobacterium sp. UT-1RO-CII-1]|uniref:DUF983 domain-containing protein n=1 Tax=Sphingobacterium sp. UT-1RO-CII-1 TaxID=2995225 RepID=UPI00227B7160|nr:DUF983 domain-containing protein [Sphingobacterium sp. UT-1RO-CII-1]MCY4780962.1 DUF983 domain-containing protein [Sphingobacterium sp. UT-1RO-CII-1]
METEYIIPKEFKSAVDGKCPRCRIGDMFEGPLFTFKSRKMRTHCPHCNLKFEKEPGYFYVAMYVSYAFVVAELIAACVATYVITGQLESPWVYLTTALAAAFIMSPFNYRYSRVVLLYWMTPSFKYRPDLYAEQKSV